MSRTKKSGSRTKMVGFKTSTERKAALEELAKSQGKKLSTVIDELVQVGLMNAYKKEDILRLNR